MSNIWNERFAAEEFAYGTAPNEFFAQSLLQLNPENILLPAEGEGRNAVFAAKEGWHVTAFDASEEGRKKAAKLARENHVSIMYELCGFTDFVAPRNFFSCIGLIYAHMPSELRRKAHQHLAQFIKPGGRVILEAFSKRQLEESHSSGGPKDADWLYSVEDLKMDFDGFQEVEITEETIQLNEGPYHQGTAVVVRMVAKK